MRVSPGGLGLGQRMNSCRKSIRSSRSRSMRSSSRRFSGPIAHLTLVGCERFRICDARRLTTNNRGIHKQKAAEYILMCVLMLNNRIPTLMNAQVRREWHPQFTDHLKGKTLLIVGVGHLGGAGARQAKRCGLYVIGVRHSGRRNRYCDEVVDPAGLHKVLPRADFIVVTAPSTSETDGMIGTREFALIKKTAGVMNFSRAQLVDYRALATRLRPGALAGVILDVLDS